LRKLAESLLEGMRNNPSISGWALTLFRKAYPIFLDYPLRSVPRYGYGKPPHQKLYTLIDRNRSIYKNFLHTFLSYKEYFLKIERYNDSANPGEPFWENTWLPVLDAMALYCFLCLNKPKRYFEIGSGNSTKFARKAVKDHDLRTKITSFDPEPRSDVDSLCDTIFRQGIEEVSLDIFDKLEAGDILFVDNSHRVFMNSDATIVFLDILPRLRKGVYVQFHDIFLPFDYPPEWKTRYYSEQYLLAAYLLAENGKFEVLLPNKFISSDPELSEIAASLWKDSKIQGSAVEGGSFWIRIT
jgi:hypothetical protein